MVVKIEINLFILFLIFSIVKNWSLARGARNSRSLSRLWGDHEEKNYLNRKPQSVHNLTLQFSRKFPVIGIKMFLCSFVKLFYITWMLVQRPLESPAFRHWRPSILTCSCLNDSKSLKESMLLWIHVLPDRIVALVIHDMRRSLGFGKQHSKCHLGNRVQTSKPNWTKIITTKTRTSVVC